MRNINQQLVERWVKAALPDPATFLRVERPPAPFPGKWPTRVFVKHEDPLGKLTTYFGKLGRRPWDVATRLANTEVIAEFDTKGIVALFLQHVWSGPRIYNNPHLWAAYHPWSVLRADVSWVLGNKKQPAKIQGPEIQWQFIEALPQAQPPQNEAAPRVRPIIANENWLRVVEDRVAQAPAPRRRRP